MNWIKTNFPVSDSQSKAEFYWLTVISDDDTVTYPYPCKFCDDNKNWVNYFLGKSIPADTVVAIMPVKYPKPYHMIGSGSGYYIKTVEVDGETIIYGFKLIPADWIGKGYSSIDKAKDALRRLIKIDNTDGTSRSSYEIINGKGEVVYCHNN